MSFAFDTKRELCQIASHHFALQRAEGYGLLLFAKNFSEQKIVFSTENAFVASRYMELLAEVWQAVTEKKTALTRKRGGAHLFTVTVPDEHDCKKIFTDLGHGSAQLNLRINRANLDDESAVAAFLRGVFLCCGTVTNPQKEYHLEFSMPYKNLCSDLCRLISEVTELTKEPRTINRKGSFIAYIKDSEQISDFLTFIGAPVAAMSIMQEKIYKDIRNTANRKTNSEIANIHKTAQAAALQIKAIEKIAHAKGLDFLPDDLKEVALLRIAYPELSLRDLGKQLKMPISRSGVNHRMQRIMEIAREIEEA